MANAAIADARVAALGHDRRPGGLDSAGCGTEWAPALMTDIHDTATPLPFAAARLLFQGHAQGSRKSLRESIAIGSAEASVGMD